MKMVLGGEVKKDREWAKTYNFHSFIPIYFIHYTRIYTELEAQGWGCPQPLPDRCMSHQWLLKGWAAESPLQWIAVTTPPLTPSCHHRLWPCDLVVSPTKEVQPTFPPIDYLARWLALPIKSLNNMKVIECQQIWCYQRFGKGLGDCALPLS